MYVLFEHNCTELALHTELAFVQPRKYFSGLCMCCAANCIFEHYFCLNNIQMQIFWYWYTCPWSTNAQLLFCLTTKVIQLKMLNLKLMILLNKIDIMPFLGVSRYYLAKCIGLGIWLSAGMAAHWQLTTTYAMYEVPWWTKIHVPCPKSSFLCNP